MLFTITYRSTLIKVGTVGTVKGFSYEKGRPDLSSKVGTRYGRYGH